MAVRRPALTTEETPAGAFFASLPPAFRDTSYNGDRHPGAPGVDGLAGGANCQHYAYEVLRLFGYDLPPLRSSDLWEDDTTTAVVPTVEQAQRFDLILFGETQDAYSAHVGLYLGDGQVLHLSYSVGQPVIWSLRQFSDHPNYHQLVGIKRPKRPQPNGE